MAAFPELQNFVLNGAEETGRQLGTGSFGSVVELRIGGVLCAGKKLHDILIDPRNEGVARMSSMFLEECRLMSEVRHPHIAQFLGICFLPSSSIPLLVTELLNDSLHNVLESRDDLPLRLKQTILTDVATGLVYLHTRTPPIIHRDLTARNVLLDKTMTAKITDFGNSRFIEKTKHSKTMTRIPGTLEYMPPEALEAHSPYSDKLDIFSFGHLALYTITQVFPSNILAATSHDPDIDKLIARTEVERRAQYMELLYEGLGDTHTLAKLIRQCLHNSPRKRPTALEALHWLDGAKVLENPDEDDDVYDTHYETLYDCFNKVEMVAYISRKELEKKQKEQEIEALRRQIDNRASVYFEEPSDPTEDNKTAPLEKMSKGRKHQWKLYTFKIVNGTHLKYFKSGVRKPQGEIALSHVTDVFPVRTGGERFCFEVHFPSRESPWILSAFSEMERRSWIEAIQKKQEPRMKACLAYGMLPSDSDVGLQCSHNSETKEQHPYDYVFTFNLQPNPSTRCHPATDDIYGTFHVSPHLESRDQHLYDYVSTHNLQSDPTTQPLPTPDDTTTERVPSNPSYVTSNAPKPPPLPPKPSTMGEAHPAVYSGDAAAYYNLPPYGTRTRPAPKVSPSPRRKLPAASAQEKEDHSNVSTLYHTASFLSSSQIEQLITMLWNIQSTLTKEDEKRASNNEVCNNVGEIQHFTSASSLPLEMQQIKTHLSPEPERSHNGTHIMPTLVPQNSPAMKHLPPPIRPRPAFDSNPSAMPFTQYKPQIQPDSSQQLKKMLKETTSLRNESLLITEDDSPDEYIQRPEWAKATMSCASLTELHQKILYISPSVLTNISELGEGNFGKVYKALMRKKQHNVPVAVKVVYSVSPNFQKEITVMTEIIHPNIVRLYGLMNEEPWKTAMVMEYLPNGDLKNFLIDNERDDNQLAKYMMDVAMGMHYLSEKGIIHRDLAARNILVDKNEVCKVADFGLVREVPKDTTVYVSRNRGPSPLRWMAPESIANRVFSHASDVWSFGILQWEMFNPTKVPYPNMENEEMIAKVANGYRMPVPRGHPPLVIRIMKACWNKDAAKRPSFLLISNLLTKEIIGED